MHSCCTETFNVPQLFLGAVAATFCAWPWPGMPVIGPGICQGSEELNLAFGLLILDLAALCSQFVYGATVVPGM